MEAVRRDTCAEVKASGKERDGVGFEDVKECGGYVACQRGSNVSRVV